MSGNKECKKLLKALPPALAITNLKVLSLSDIDSTLPEVISRKLPCYHLRNGDKLRARALRLSGSEEAASQLILKLVEAGLAELEEEAELQEAVGEVNAFLKRNYPRIPKSAKPLAPGI